MWKLRMRRCGGGEGNREGRRRCGGGGAHLNHISMKTWSGVWPALTQDHSSAASSRAVSMSMRRRASAREAAIQLNEGRTLGVEEGWKGGDERRRGKGGVNLRGL